MGCGTLKLHVQDVSMSRGKSGDANLSTCLESGVDAAEPVR